MYNGRISAGSIVSPVSAMTAAISPITPASGGASMIRASGRCARMRSPYCRAAVAGEHNRLRSASRGHRSSVAAGSPTAGASICRSRAGVNAGSEPILVQRREDVAALRVGPDPDDGAGRQIAAGRLRERVERRHRGDPPLVHERQSLDRRDPDAQAGE